MSIRPICGCHRLASRGPILTSPTPDRAFRYLDRRHAPVWVYEGSDGVLEIINEATRATRIAKLAPGTLIRVEVIGKLRQPRAQNPKVGDRL